MKPPTRWSRPAQVMVVLALILLFGYLNGCLGDDQVNVTEAEAIEIALAQVDFEPAEVSTKFGRSGFGARPVWAVLLIVLSTDPDDPDGFEHRAVVEIDATNGEVNEVRFDEGSD
ncbi:MAG: PepSY domain-containing protein [Actinomycetota bacterium]|nr:PepSY domain-containing protein [Actinomycetota bacterium]MEC9424256.1 PepSY domain-containing protein [Actinomycetota bacterium]MEE2957745.1 PepSY domain-containing protein [Actinomycetota bacterium]